MDWKFVWLAVGVPLLGFVASGFVTGWLWAKGRRLAATGACILGIVLTGAAYSGLFAWYDVFAIKNEIR